MEQNLTLDMAIRTAQYQAKMSKFGELMVFRNEKISNEYVA